MSDEEAEHSGSDSEYNSDNSDEEGGGPGGLRDLREQSTDWLKQVPRLDGWSSGDIELQFPMWATRFHAHLDTNDLLPVISMTDAQAANWASANVSSDDRRIWRYANKLLYQVLVGKVCDTALASALNKVKNKNGRKLMKHLEETFRSTTDARGTALMLELLNITWSPSTTTDSFFVRFLQLKNELARLEQPANQAHLKG
jgi:hypothetical protein